MRPDVITRDAVYDILAGIGGQPITPSVIAEDHVVYEAPAVCGILATLYTQ